ncbi:MAG: C2H2-type zinc finger protein [Candidatus Freyarchaeum deiterrae]
MSIKCPQCGKMFKTPDELKKHQGMDHKMGAKPGAMGPAKPAAMPPKPAAMPPKPAGAPAKPSKPKKK